MGKRTVTELPDFVMATIECGPLHLLFLRQIGSGSYGAVYKALDLASPMHNRTFFAIKCIRKPNPSTPQAKHLAREINLHQIMSHHPHVITLHHIVDEGDFVFLVMDYCSGGDMFTAIAEHKVYAGNDRLIKATFVDLIDTVSACHDRHVFHRDLKPENILCSEDGTQIFLADFGLATSHRVSREFNAGSSSYMSPECLRQRAFGYTPSHADIWALGVILTTMITSRYPWLEASTSDASFADYLKHPHALGLYLHISDEAGHILQRIFCVDPMKRIRLTELREEILKLNTFSRDPVDLQSTRIEPLPRSPGVEPLAGTMGGGIDTRAEPPSSLTTDDAINIPAILISTGTLSPSSSTASSAGPITPETLPACPDIEIPDEDILELDSGRELHAQPEETCANSKIMDGKGIWKSAVVRVVKAVSWRS